MLRLVSPDRAIFQAAGQDPAGQSLAASIERDDCGIFGNCGGKPGGFRRGSTAIKYDSSPVT